MQTLTDTIREFGSQSGGKRACTFSSQILLEVPKKRKKKKLAPTVHTDESKGGKQNATSERDHYD